VAAKLARCGSWRNNADLRAFTADLSDSLVRFALVECKLRAKGRSQEIKKSRSQEDKKTRRQEGKKVTRQEVKKSRRQEDKKARR